MQHCNLSIILKMKLLFLWSYSKSSGSGILENMRKVKRFVVFRRQHLLLKV